MRGFGLSALAVAALVLVVQGAVAGEAGQTIPGTTAYPNSGLVDHGAWVGEPTSRQLWYGGIDAANNYAYLAASMSPGQFVKMALGSGTEPPRQVAVLELTEESPQYTLVDAANGYAYVWTQGDSSWGDGEYVDPDPASRLLKIALGDGDAAPRLVATVTMEADESSVIRGVLDPVRRHAYVLTRTAGRIVMFDLGEGDAPPRRLGAIPMSASDYWTPQAIDPANGYLYASAGNPSNLVKLKLHADGSLPSEVSRMPFPAGQAFWGNLLLDPTTGHGYLRTAADRLTKLSLGAGDTAPSPVSYLTIPEESRFESRSAIDTLHGYAYYLFLTDLYKVSLGADDTSPTLVAKVPKPHNPLVADRGCFLMDADDGHAFIVERDSANRTGSLDLVGKVDLGVGDAAPTFLSTDYVTQGDSQFYSQAYDEAGGMLYLGTVYGQIVKVSVGTPSERPRLIGVTEVGDILDTVDSLAVDPARGYGLAVVESRVGDVRLLKFRLGAPGEAMSAIGFVDLPDGSCRIALDTLAGKSLVWQFVVGNPSATLVKFDPGDGDALPTIVSQVPVAGDGAAVHLFDAATGYSYFANSAGFFKVATGAGDAAPVAIGPLVVEGTFAGVIDPTRNRAYLLAEQSYRLQLVRIDLGAGNALPMLVDQIPFAGSQDDGGRLAVTVDRTTGRLYVAEVHPPESTSWVLRQFDVSNAAAPMTPLEPVQLSSPRSFFATEISPIVDSASRQLIAATTVVLWNKPGWVQKFSFAHHRDRIQATKFALWEAAASVETVKFHSHAAAGNLRLALYDNAEPKNLVWQSGAIVNTAADADVTVPISAGVPASLSLQPETYWAAWQTDSAEAVGSYTAGTVGDGFALNQAFGPAPATLSAAEVTTTGERWTESIGYTSASGLARWVVF